MICRIFTTRVIIMHFKDLFISYGRRESLNFVARLHQKLKLAGYDAWFDKVNKLSKSKATVIAKPSR